ncbi:MAG: hypothetical protein AAB933_00380 [Patescibacteria group bacterium]
MSEFDAKPEDIVSKLESSDASVSESKFDWLTELQEESDKVETIEDKENQGIIKMRDRWSNWILFLIVLIVLFDMTLVIFLGSGVWNFTNPSIVIVVITDNFLKIVGLGYLITRSIFKKIFD